MKLTTVSKAEFDAFIAGRPTLQGHYTAISDPGQFFWYEPGTYPEGIVAKKIYFKGDPRMPPGTDDEYQIAQ